MSVEEMGDPEAASHSQPGWARTPALLPGDAVAPPLQGGHKTPASHPSIVSKEALTVWVASILVILQPAHRVYPTPSALALHPVAWPAATVLCTVRAEPLLPRLGARDPESQSRISQILLSRPLPPVPCAPKLTPMPSLPT